MIDNKNTFTIYLKVQSLATNIKNYFNISYRDAMKLLGRQFNRLQYRMNHSQQVK